jgi:hypothetical protein
MLALTLVTAGQRFVKVWQQASSQTPQRLRQRRTARRRAARSARTRSVADRRWDSLRDRRPR